MPYIIRIEGLSGVITTQPEAGGRAQRTTYLKSYDPEAHDGRGDAVATHDVAEAQLFAAPEEAYALWQTQPKSRPWREDGAPNRPLTAFTISVIPAPEADS